MFDRSLSRSQIENKTLIKNKENESPSSLNFSFTTKLKIIVINIPSFKSKPFRLLLDKEPEQISKGIGVVN
jgi:hypothetical protein